MVVRILASLATIGKGVNCEISYVGGECHWMAMRVRATDSQTVKQGGMESAEKIG